MKCSGENVILRGIFHAVSCFPLHFYVISRERWLLFGQCTCGVSCYTVCIPGLYLGAGRLVSTLHVPEAKSYLVTPAQQLTFPSTIFAAGKRKRFAKRLHDVILAANRIDVNNVIWVSCFLWSLRIKRDLVVPSRPRPPNLIVYA